MDLSILQMWERRASASDVLIHVHEGQCKHIANAEGGRRQARDGQAKPQSGGNEGGRRWGGGGRMREAWTDEEEAILLITWM